jgi:RNA polymerase sigma-70 factor (ECF subfamily)
VTHRRDSLSDHELVRQAQAGDIEAFTQLVRRHERRVRSITARMLDDPRDAEEAAQDTFLNAWRAQGAFRGDAAVATWLHRIAVNTALAAGRRRRPPSVPLDPDHPAEPGADPARDTPERVDRIQAMRAALDAIPARYRVVLVLRDLEGFTNQEVADIVGITVANVKSRLHRGRRALQRLLHPT